MNTNNKTAASFGLTGDQLDTIGFQGFDDDDAPAPAVAEPAKTVGTQQSQVVTAEQATILAAKVQRGNKFTPKQIEQISLAGEDGLTIRCKVQTLFKETKNRDNGFDLMGKVTYKTQIWKVRGLVKPGVAFQFPTIGQDIDCNIREWKIEETRPSYAVTFALN